VSRRVASSIAALLAILAPRGAAPAAERPIVLAKPAAIDASGARLRWDAVEGPPFWVSGPRPGFAPGWGPHAIRLEPGERVTLLVPGSSILRIHARKGERAADLEAWTFDGFGLETEVPILRSSDPHAFFVSTGSLTPRRVALELPGPPSPRGPSREGEGERESEWARAAREGLEISLFLSRIVAYPTASLHRTLLDLPGEPVGVSSSSIFPGERHWRVEGSSLAPFVIEGPARLALVTRFEAQRGEPAAVQGYRLRVIVNGAERLFDFETGIDPAEEELVDGTPALLGNRRTAWFEVPGGEHRVSLRSSAPLLVRLLRASEKDTLLATLPGEDVVHARPPTGTGTPALEDFFGRGSPTPSRLSREDAKRGREVTAETRRHGGEKSGEGEEDREGEREGVKAVREGLADAGTIAPSPADIASLFRDIRRADSALLAAMYCRDLALRVALPPETRACAIDAFRRHTRYRSIAPADKPVPSSQSFCWFVARRLAMPGDDVESSVLEEHLGEALDGFSPGFFIDLPPDRESSLLYRIPERFAPSILRVAVDTSRPGDRCDLLVEIDDGPPSRLRFDPARAAPRDAAAPLRADAALAALRELFPRFAPSTFSGPFGAFRTPAPIVEVTTAEIPLPREATRIRVWSDGPGAPSRAALQYLTEEPRAATDAERTAALRALRLEDPGSSPLRTALDAWSRADGPPRGEAASDGEEPLRELLTGYAPLFRLLGEARDGFVRGSSPPRGADDIARNGAENTAPKAAENTAPKGAAAAGAVEALEESSDWLPALEARALALDARSPDDRRAARLGVIRALEGLGERFLAGAQLRGTSLEARDEKLRHEVFDLLLEHERESDDPGDVIGPLAWAALDHEDPEVLRRLAEALADDGAREMALVLAGGLPLEERPLEVILRAAASLRRWSVFDGALEALPDLEDWHYWKGVREACAWNTDAALRNLASGGSRGRELERVLRRALAIREGLASDDPGRRARSVLSWEEWQAVYPGPRRWVEDPALVLDHAGFAPCRSVARRLLERFYLARPSRPLVFEAAGPATIRIEARPIHRSAGAREGWLEVREDGLLRVVPITANVPAPGIEVSGIDGARPGRKVIADVRIGAGVRRLEVLAPGMDLLARVLVEEPEIVTGILPPLSPFTLRQALRKSGGDPLSGRDAAGSAVLVRADGAAAGVPLVPLDALDAPAPWRRGDMEPVLAARMALRGGGDPADPGLRAGLEEIASGRSPGVRAEEALLARARLGVDPDPLSLPGLPVAVLEAALLAKGRASDIIRMPAGPVPQDLRRRLAILTHIAESDEALRRTARAAGESTYRRHHRVPGIGGLFLRLVRGTDWMPIASVRDSAGMRRVDVPPSSPEAPELRVRKALLSPFRADERLVAGGNRLGLSLATGRPIVLEIELRLDTVEFLPRESVAALYQLDDGEPREVRLGPEQDSRKVELLVPEGDHAVRLWIEEPVANHFLRVRVREVSPAPPRGEGETAKGGAGEPAWSEAGEKRLYFLATRERPVRAVIEGPAWIRADELRDGSTYTTYREVPEGFHELSFLPAEGRDEGLFRIFERAETGPEKAPRPVEPREPIPAVEAPLAALEERSEPPGILVSDAFHLGGHEDGTLSLELAGRRVRLFDEDEGSPGANQYLQLEGAHRLFDELSSTWFETALLARAHERGGPALGIREEILHEPRWFPAALRLAATGFIQWPDGGSAEFDGPAETSATLRGSMSRRFGLGLTAYHMPSVALFGRVLSLEDSDDYRPGDIDPDVFTEYKNDHRHGLVLSESAGWRPWLDSELWIRGSVTSNEDMNPLDPDHVTGVVGWKQYWEGFQLDVHFQATEFFEDSDRSDQRLRQAIGFAVYTDLWASPSDRLEAGCEILQDLTEGETSGQVFLAWHWSRGRGYRDFRPGAIDFSPLRAARIPLDRENRIEEVR